MSFRCPAAHPGECIAYYSCQVWKGVLVCAGPEGDEAEYAWLSANNLKPFKQGDSQMVDPAMTGNDPSLRECILAAERNVTDFLARAAAREKARAEQQEVAQDEADTEAATDSDGGDASCHCLLLRLKLLTDLKAEAAHDTTYYWHTICPH